ncbi:MAG: prepilin-type N-terminal cleavage/methylation domain-containing protein [Sideroxyarcus sp.]
MTKPVPSTEFGVLSGVQLPQRSTLRTQNSALGTQHSLKGFTLLELIVVISVIAILAGSLLSRVPIYTEQAEQAAMEQTVGALQSALTMRVGSLMTHGAATEKELKALASDNPLDWLQQKPKNYAGEFFNPTPKTVVPGQWVFDLKSRDLIYVVDRGDHFTTGKDGQKWIRFHVKFEYEASPSGSAGGKKALTSALFEPTETYRWFD